MNLGLSAEIRGRRGHERTWDKHVIIFCYRFNPLTLYFKFVRCPEVYIKILTNLDFEGTLEDLLLSRFPKNQPRRVHLRVHLGVHEGIIVLEYLQGPRKCIM